MRKLFLSRHDRTSKRGGFTLVELLVVITIIVILLTMTLLTVNFSNEGDRVKGAAGQVQSFLAGARDRAIYAKEPRGVRFFVNPENPRAVNTMAYIAPGGSWSSPENSANISLERRDLNGDGDFVDLDVEVPPGSNVFLDEPDVVVVRGRQNPGWWNLKRRGWLVDGLRIRIPKGPTGNWYPIDTRLIDTSIPPTPDQLLLLQIPFADAGIIGQRVAHPDLTYEIELPSKLLAQDPAILPESVVIDLDASKIPDGWRPQFGLNNGNYSGYMDVIFSPRGNILGDAAGAGVMHLYVGDAEDSQFLRERFEAAYVSRPGSTRPSFTSNSPFVPMDEIPLTVSWMTGDAPYLTKDRRIVTVFTQTGAVSVHEVNGFFSEGSALTGDSEDPLDFNNNSVTNEPDGLADDPYFFAETGKAAK
jgi:prepilin-type N-terminal cleavage/methylation domain-containing protein